MPAAPLPIPKPVLQAIPAVGRQPPDFHRSIRLWKLQHTTPDAHGNASTHLRIALPLLQQLLHRCDMAVGRLGASLIPQDLRDDSGAQCFLLCEQLRGRIAAFPFSF